MADEIEIDGFEPDYCEKCTVCGASPTVSAVKGRAEVYSTEMCGPCTFGTAAALDPSTWDNLGEVESG